MTEHAAQRADLLIESEIARQKQERRDNGLVHNGELMQGAVAQIALVDMRRHGAIDPVPAAQTVYPKGWKGLQDYVNDLPNLIAAAALLKREITRRIAKGDTVYPNIQR